MQVQGQFSPSRMKYRSWQKWKKYSRIKVSHITTCSATDMTVMTLEKNVGPQVAFYLIYLQLLFLIQSMKISLCFVHILTFLPGRNIFSSPTTWKAPIHLSNITSHFVSFIKSSLNSPGQAWKFLPHWVLWNLMHVFVEDGISL